MANVPLAVLSERIQASLQGRELHTAVFTTFEFDPGFFEQEIVPVLLDEAVSHAISLRLVQLEDKLRTIPGGIAVFYDSERLSIGEPAAGRLDIRRVPVRHKRGVFHPKNVFLLLDDVEKDENGHRARTLVVASLSANLTRSGWWENVEVGHVEEIGEDGKTRLRDDLIYFLASLQRQVKDRAENDEVGEIIRFLKATEQRQHKTLDGHLLPHFYSGREDFVDFLSGTLGGMAEGFHLEVISPYFDEAAESAVLQDLIDRFKPKAARIFLPRDDSGVIACRRDLFESIRGLPSLEWGCFPGELLARGAGEAAKKRFVHAKVIRLFSRNPSREFCFVGSVNLTRSAHRRSNVESGFLVEIDAARRPEFWLLPEEGSCTAFAPPPSEDESKGESYCPADIRYHWDTGLAEINWDAPNPPNSIEIRSRGLRLGSAASFPSKAWHPLQDEVASRFKETLTESSLMEIVVPGRPPTTILVQEEGMSHKPSLLKTLSAADILQYWSQLTTEQRAAFLADRMQEVKSLGLGEDLVTPLSKLIDHNTVFDRFAGIFHAFGCLEREALRALEEGNTKVADFRVFGMKYDSLGSLLSRLEDEAKGQDHSVESYLTLLCARQLCRTLRSKHSEYWRTHSADATRLESQMAGLAVLRQRLIDNGPSDMPDFLTWFDARFLNKATGPATETVQ